jgi:succinate dehydrogenase / fumarate reductase, cytochrome b subunit
MSSPLKFLDSSIGRKVLMSLTGLFLCTFLIIHVTGNLQLFNDDDGLAFNQYTVFMTTFPPIKIISYLLYASIILHVLNGARITLQNQKARPVGYKAMKDPRSSSWASKNMGILGTVLLVFLVTHMANFWYEFKFGDMPWKEYTIALNSGELIGSAPYVNESGAPLKPHEILSTDASGMAIKTVVVKDLYEVVKQAFTQSWLVILYLLGMAALAYHLVHGFQSGFQTLGLRHPSYTPIIQGIGVWFFGIIIPILFAAMPVYFYFFMNADKNL